MSLPVTSSNAGNTIAVGNLTDLAGILANLSPEQLQNIQLDPVLFEALSKNIEPTTVVPQTVFRQPTADQQDLANALLNQQPLVNQEQAISSTELQNILINQQEALLTANALVNLQQGHEHTNVLVTEHDQSTNLLATQHQAQTLTTADTLINLQQDHTLPTSTNEPVLINNEQPVTTDITSIAEDLLAEHQQRLLQKPSSSADLPVSNIAISTPRTPIVNPASAVENMVLHPLQAPSSTQLPVENITINPSSQVPLITNINGENIIINQQPMVTDIPLSTTANVQQIPLANVLDPSATNLNNINLVVSNANGLISTCPATLIATPQKTQLADVTSNVLLQQSPVHTNPLVLQQQSPILMVDQAQQQALMLQNLQPGQQIQATANLHPILQSAAATTNFQGIRPGESSSLILTPTVMSQVQPTPTIQTINLTDGTVTTNLQPGAIESLIMTQPTFQPNTINILQEQMALQPSAVSLANLASAQQMPVSTTLLPSTITINPALLKRQNITIDPASLMAQNLQIHQTVPQQPATVSSLLLDGNQLVDANNLIALSQVIVSGMSTQPVASLQQPLGQTVLSNQMMKKSSKIKFPATGFTPQKIMKMNKQQTSAGSPMKKPKIQIVKNLSPDSPIFNQSKNSKSTASSTARNPNVTVKKISVSGKKSADAIPVKPTSVEQVQPGVFKFQLKKVKSSEATALLSNNTITSKDGGKIETSLAELINSTKITDLQSKGRTAIKNTSTGQSQPGSQVSKTKPVTTAISVKLSNLPKDVLSKLKDLGKFSSIKISTSPSISSARCTQGVSTPGKDSVKLNTTKPINKTNQANPNAADTAQSQAGALTTPRRVSIPTVSPALLRATLEAKKLAATTKSAPSSATNNAQTPKNVNKVISTKTTIPLTKTNGTPKTSQSTLLQKPMNSPVSVTKNVQGKDVRVTPPGKTPQQWSSIQTQTKNLSSKTPQSVVLQKSSTTSIAAGISESQMKDREEEIAFRQKRKLERQSSSSGCSQGDGVEALSNSNSNIKNKNSNQLENVSINRPTTDLSRVLNAKTSSAGSQTTKKKISQTSISSPRSQPTKASTVAENIRKASRSNSKEVDDEDSLECEEKGFTSPESKKTRSISPSRYIIDIKKLPKIPLKKSGVMEKANAVLQKAKSTGTSGTKTANAGAATGQKAEVESIRNAIESSRVGQPEVNMREMAKMEIEKQLKRMSDPKKSSSSNKDDSSVPKSSKKLPTNSNESKKSITNSSDSKKAISNTAESNKQVINKSASETTEKRMDLKRKNDDSSTNTTDSETIKSPNEKKTKNEHSTATSSSVKKSHKVGGARKKLNTLILDENRKRERPKKYDDFILAPEAKKSTPEKTKKGTPEPKNTLPETKPAKKAKKFFFPKEAKSEPENITESENDSDRKSGKPKNDEVVPKEEKTESVDSKDNQIETEIEPVKSESECENDIIPEDKPDSNSKESILDNTDKVDNKNPESKSKSKVSPAVKSNKKPLQNSNKKKANTKSNAKSGTKNKSKKRKQKTVAFEPEVLPEHLKTKSKPKTEDTVIDLSKVTLKSSFTETSFILNDQIEVNTYKHLNRKNWVCTLCGRPGNLGTLDVLFGPYKIKVKDSGNKENGTQMNVWLHRDCAVWTSNICLSDQTLLGLGESLDEAALTKCCLCSKVGATLQCGYKQCRDGYHFVCAKQRGCSFQMENFTITCPKHR
ncbi:serine-rich adhesin for platelets-like [Clytia hemisphaerica]|uniref:serine-rich adhesin for platelets-like n=1 Tax=Clytia hemisphaerica TaxID=252671 RepID=UPI0034D7B2DF